LSKEVVESQYQRLLEVRKKIHRSIGNVFKLLKKEPLNRDVLIEVLTHLRSDVKALVELIDSIEKCIDKIKVEIGYQQMFKQLPPVLAVIFAILLAFSESPRRLKYDFEQHVSNLKYIIAKVPRRYSFGDHVYSSSNIKEELYEELSSLLEHFRTLEIRMESKLYRMGYTTIRHVPTISILDLVTFHVSDRLRLDDKWVCTATHLAALEVGVNKVCSEFNIKADEFKARLNKLV